VFEAELNWAESTAWLTLRGSLEHNAVMALEIQVDQILCSPFTCVVLEVDDLRMIDQVGVRCLIGLYQRVIRSGQRITLNGAEGTVASALAGSPLARAMSPSSAKPESRAIDQMDEGNRALYAISSFSGREYPTEIDVRAAVRSAIS
jgi:anti-anti-sigma factor